MGGRFARVQYREQDAAVLPHFLPLTRVWGLREIALLSVKLRRLSFNFCLTNEQFADLLSLRGNPLFRSMLDRWFASFQNTKTSTIVNGLEVLTSLAIASADGKLADKAGAVFDIFDFDESGAITLDELNILLKSVVRGLSKLTTGLGPRLAMLCPMPEIAELARQCFQASDLEEEQDLSRDLFVQWVKHTPKIVNLLRCFAQKEFMTDEEAAITIQRAVRGMHGRRRAAEIRLEKQLELEQEITQAVDKIQEATASRKKKRDNLRQLKIEKFAHHGALYTFGSNGRGQLGHPLLDLGRQLTAPLLTPFFKNNELRVTRVAISSVHACAVTSNGQMFTWGAGVPGSFGFLSKRVTLSENTEQGGKSNSSQSSSTSTSTVPARRQPTRVDDLDDVAIVDCCLGNHHSVALSDNGAVYTWGSAGFGQLGHGDIAMTETGGSGGSDSDAIYKKQFDQHTGREYPFIELPTQLDRSLFEEMRILQVVCGYYCTLAICEDGSLYSWGEGSDGQLGIGYTDGFQVGFLDDHIHSSSFVFMHTPTRIDSIKEPIGHISIGGNHVYAVTRDHKKVLEWGAWHRRLGDAQDSAFTPQENPSLGVLGIDRIASGKEHALAVGARIELTFTVDEVRYQDCSDSANSKEEPFKTVALCAVFGSQPGQLTRELSGSLFCISPPSVRPGTGNERNISSSSTLNDCVRDRSEASIRASLARCVGKIVFLDRGTPSGFWISMLLEDTGAGRSSLLEIPCIPAAFGPQLTDSNLSTRLFYTPQKLRCLRLYVRPDEIVGKVVVLEFDQHDVEFESDDMELGDMIARIMLTLVEKVKDAQEAGAAGVIIVFDFLEADAFPLEIAEDDTFDFSIPTVMVRRLQHGELLLEQLQTLNGSASASGGKHPFVILSYKDDILGKQILAAQKFGARAVVVAQNRIEQEPIRLRTDVFARSDEKAPENAVKLPVVTISFEAGETIRTSLIGVDVEDTTVKIRQSGFGQLYAWGFGQNGRLGLGDLENEEVFQTGFDGARQISYQYVTAPEIVPSLLDKRVVDVACGEEHSAAVTGDGTLYCWGSGRYGKLGNGSNEDELVPFAVQSLSSVHVAKVACGAHQTFAVTQNPSLKATSTRD